MSTFVTTGASAIGLATLAADGTVLDTWYPAPELSDNVAASGSTRLTAAEAEAALGGEAAQALQACAVRNTTVVAVRTDIKSLADAPADAHDAYLRLHLLSHRLVQPHGANVTGIFGLLANVAWTNFGPCAVADVPPARLRARASGRVLEVKGVDKFPQMTDYVIPSGARIANAGIGISLGDDCVVEAGCYITGGSRVQLPDGSVIKAKDLSGKSGILFRRDSQSGALHAIPRNKSWGELNAELHKN